MPVESPVQRVAAPGRRILIAEDNETMQELLQFLLTQRGHEVDVVSDGESALAAISANPYDVVMLDFHLPKMDGLEVAAAARSKGEAGRMPRFVAITGDMKGLLSHAANCENFDRVVAKPFDLDDVCRVIEGEATKADAGRPAPPRPRPRLVETGTPAPWISRPAQRFETLGFKFLVWPEGFQSRGGGPSVPISPASDYEAVLVCEQARPVDLAALWTEPTLHVLPVIDLVGGLGPRADLNLNAVTARPEEEVDRVVRTFNFRRERLHHDLIFAEELADRLVARVFMGGERLVAHYEPNSSNAVCFNLVHDFAQVDHESSILVETGFLERQFFDRLYLCDRCGGSRFNFREECAHCRSPNLSEEPYLHHFRCAYQGLESDFRQGDALICPKCRRQLSHYGVDYDKPGIMLKCGTCGRSNSEAVVGALCLDCQAHYDGDQAKQRDIYSYGLTDHALAYLTTGRALLGGRSRALRFAELPLDVIVALNGELRKNELDGTPFTLIDISYQYAREIEHQHGPKRFHQVRDLFLENLRSVLRPEDRVFRGQAYDFALLRGISVEQAQTGLAELREQATASLGLNLGVAMHAYGPDAFA